MGCTYNRVAVLMDTYGLTRSKINAWVRYGLIRKRESRTKKPSGLPDYIEVCAEDVANLVANPPRRGPKAKKK